MALNYEPVATGPGEGAPHCDVFPIFTRVHPAVLVCHLALALKNACRSISKRKVLQLQPATAESTLIKFALINVVFCRACQLAPAVVFVCRRISVCEFSQL